MKEKTLEQTKKTIDLIEQNTYEKKNTKNPRKNTIPESIILAKERHTIKDESRQKLESSERNQRADRHERDHVDYAGHRIGHHYTSVHQ